MLYNFSVLFIDSQYYLLLYVNLSACLSYECVIGLVKKKAPTDLSDLEN